MHRDDRSGSCRSLSPPSLASSWIVAKVLQSRSEPHVDRIKPFRYGIIDRENGAVEAGVASHIAWKLQFKAI